MSAQTIPEDRRVSWSNAGLLQQIMDPDLFIDVSDYGAMGNGTTNDSPAIQAAIAALNGQAGIVFFPAGTYLLTENIITHSGLIIRGEGSQQTQLKFYMLNPNQHAFSISSSPQNEFQAVLSGFQKDSFELEINNSDDFAAGDFIEIQQSNGDWDVVPVGWAENVVGQIIQIEDVNENTLSLRSALRIDYDLSLNPILRKIEPITNVKIENLKVERLDEPEDDGAKNFYISYAANCQISGVESHKSHGSHIYISASTNIFVFGNYIHDAFLFDGTATRGYGVTLNKHCGEVLVENNIFRNLRHAMMVKTGANGNVFTYNYSREPHRSEPISNYSGDISVHGHYAYANLFEENIVQNIIIDHYWGPGGPLNTFFRNRTELFGLIMTENSLLETNDQNFVGNEITNSFPYGFYTLTGNNHFEYGNNDGGLAVPSGTSDLSDISYYYNEKPWFLEADCVFPCIGYPHNLNQWSISAKERYLNGGPYTIIYPIEGGVNINENFGAVLQAKVLTNPVQDILSLQTESTYTFHFSIFNLTGSKVQEGFLSGNSQHQISISSLSNGIYFIALQQENKRLVLKFSVGK
ncbi:MAG: hypothetical protein B7C24_13045 [Bacteroidetes bacterium 4572_77]|nr:MAG: hypothetical protein B7C24_13045 [Bacteroidetes bacterium 4572_77]